MDYKKIILENKNSFQDEETLEDFINSYSGDDIEDYEDYLHEYADGLVPVYNGQIIEEWSKENIDGLTIDETGEYTANTIIGMMMEDLYFFHFNALSEDYQTLKDLVKEED